MLKTPRQHSFSLIEVMVAVAVLGIGIAGVLSCLSGSLQCAKRVQQRMEAYDLLRLKTAEWAGENKTVDALTGKFEAPFETYAWRVEITPTDLTGLYSLRVSVSWPGQGIRRQIQIKTLVPQR
jgi:prepilin-type N-terminal cleavage/methylation domain-containing protein